MFISPNLGTLSSLIPGAVSYLERKVSVIFLCPVPHFFYPGPIQTPLQVPRGRPGAGVQPHPHTKDVTDQHRGPVRHLYLGGIRLVHALHHPGYFCLQSSSIDSIETLGNPSGSSMSPRPNLLVGQHTTVAAYRKCPQLPRSAHSLDMQPQTKLHPEREKASSSSRTDLQMPLCKMHTNEPLCGTQLSVSLCCYPALVFSHLSTSQRDLQVSLLTLVLNTVFNEALASV